MLHLIAGIILCCCSAAASVITSVTCRPGQGPTVVGEDACSAEGGIGPFGVPIYARAAASATVSLPSLAGDFAVAAIPFYLDVDSSASGSSATAFASIDFLITSEGPVRPGLLIWSEYFVYGETRASVNGEEVVSCIDMGIDSYCRPEFMEWVAVTLGQPFPVHMERRAATRVILMPYNDEASRFYFRLVEGDGSLTPVRMELVPEPGTVLMMMIAGAFWIAAKAKSPARR